MFNVYFPTAEIEYGLRQRMLEEFKLEGIIKTSPERIKEVERLHRSFFKEIGEEEVDNLLGLLNGSKLWEALSLIQSKKTLTHGQRAVMKLILGH